MDWNWMSLSRHRCYIMISQSVINQDSDAEDESPRRIGWARPDVDFNCTNTPRRSYTAYIIYQIILIEFSASNLNYPYSY